jgi:RNA polymerase sigma-70 factor (ECF subfamily)
VIFEEVYERYKRPVWRLARRLTGNDDEAFDATQEIFLRVWRGLGGFRGDAKLSTWVFQVAWNYLRGHHRRNSRQLRPLGEYSPEVVARTPDPSPGPERRVVSSDLLDRVARAMEELPEHYRIVVWLRDGEDLSYAEIAEVLDLPIGTVRSRLARARSTLKKAVELT